MAELSAEEWGLRGQKTHIQAPALPQHAGNLGQVASRPQFPLAHNRVNGSIRATSGRSLSEVAVETMLRVLTTTSVSVLGRP